MNIVNLLVCLFECQYDVVSFKIITKVPLPTQLTYLAGTCNALESKRLRFTLHAERTTPTTIPLTLSSSLHVKGLTQGWWDGL